MAVGFAYTSVFFALCFPFPCYPGLHRFALQRASFFKRFFENHENPKQQSTANEEKNKNDAFWVIFGKKLTEPFFSLGMAKWRGKMDEAPYRIFYTLKVLKKRTHFLSKP